MRYWKFLHILSMFTGVTILVGMGMLFERVAHTRDVGAIRRVGPVVKTIGNIGIAGVSLGVVFGIVTAIVGDLGLASTWLIVAYVLVGLLFVLGPIEGAHAGKVTAAAVASPIEQPSPELEALVTDPKWPLLSYGSVVLYVLVIFDMVVKPF